MTHRFRRFTVGSTLFARRTTWADIVVLFSIAVILYVGATLASYAPTAVAGPKISLAPSALPLYAMLSLYRMAVAYVLSITFSLIYGYVAAKNRRAEQVLMPLLDVLQSVPILSFLPVVLLSFSAVMRENIAAELGAIVLIFTSQAWNMTYAWYQSLTTIPNELREATAVFRFNSWLRLKALELPFGAISLIWNSMMSWAGGWFFLMAAEIFTVGDKDFRLPGLGSYLQTAANAGDVRAILLGVFTLILLIVALDQLVWRPLLVWAERFKMEMVSSDDNIPRSWFYEIIQNSALIFWFNKNVLKPVVDKLDTWLIRRFPSVQMETGIRRTSQIGSVFIVAIVALFAYGGYRAIGMLMDVTLAQWWDVLIGLAATFVRVTVALSIALAWTIPLGWVLGTNRKLANWLQPLVQIAASIPATALFPILLLFLISLPGGVNIASVALMLMGTQWYLLFNVIAGASAVPQDLKYTSALLGMSNIERWRTLILPALFPYIVTGAITSSGGAWNASIVAEYAEFSGKTVYTTGIGSLISRATADGDFPLLLASTLTMILAVVLINRLFWRRLYKLVEDKYRME